MSNSKQKPAICSQCSTPAADASGFCVDHLVKYQQVISNQKSMLDSQLNYLNRQMYISTGGLIPLNQIDIRPSPQSGNKITMTNLTLTNSTIGTVNNGYARNIDSVITTLNRDGDEKLASAFQDFTEAVLDSNELVADVRDEIVEIVEVLSRQTQLDPANRTKTIPSLMSRIRDVVTVGGSVLGTWNTLEPLLKGVFVSSQ